jgi:hypothetical protein
MPSEELSNLATEGLTDPPRISGDGTPGEPLHCLVGTAPRTAHLFLGRKFVDGRALPQNCFIGQRLARFRQINMDNPVTHHDALEFPDGQVVLLARLCEGQRATVLQLPAGARAATAEGAVVEPQLRESSLSI